MTNLYIDGRQAVLEAGTNIKITAENPLFTDAGTYTLEVTLPLDGCAENQRIFGAIHRPDVLKGELVAKRWNFVLVAPPLHIEGKARISTVDHESVKVQLLAGRSALNDAWTNSKDSTTAICMGGCLQSPFAKNTTFHRLIHMRETCGSTAKSHTRDEPATKTQWFCPSIPQQTK